MMARTLLLFSTRYEMSGTTMSTPRRLGLGEHEAGIDDDNVVFIAEGEAVHAELAESA